MMKHTDNDDIKPKNHGNETTMLGELLEYATEEIVGKKLRFTVGDILRLLQQRDENIEKKIKAVEAKWVEPSETEDATKQ